MNNQTKSSGAMASNFEILRAAILKFRDERDWKQFHSPKNLAEGLMVESAELMENFLWKKSGRVSELSKEELSNVKDEIADIFIYLNYLCEEFGIDLLEIVQKKIKINSEKYPVEKSKGNAKKYTEL